MICPTHNTTLVPRRTRYGTRFTCATDGCTVACWGGQTSTPADDETRSLRHECHKVFDPMWKKRTKFASRGHAYTWLAHFMGVDIHDAHIGMFDKAQCLRLLAELGGKPIAKE